MPSSNGVPNPWPSAVVQSRIGRPELEARWKQRLAGYYREHGLDPAAPINAANRAPFDAAFCEVVEELKPEVVSFHFGLPDPKLLQRVKAAGATVMLPSVLLSEPFAVSVAVSDWAPAVFRVAEKVCRPLSVAVNV